MTNDLDHEISRIAPELRKEWETPQLWPRIEEALAREASAKRRWPLNRRALLAAAAAVVVAAVVLRPGPSGPRPAITFLSEQGLSEAERAEAASTRAIEALARLADPQLARADTPKAANCSEKLLVLDTEIATLRADAGQNRFNAYLRQELAGLYREKQQTLKEFLSHAQAN